MYIGREKNLYNHSRNLKKINSLNPSKETEKNSKGQSKKKINEIEDNITENSSDIKHCFLNKKSIKLIILYRGCLIEEDIYY